MRSSLSLLATVSRGQPSKLRKPAISLDHFIQRQRVLALWREIVRALNSRSSPAKAYNCTADIKKRSPIHLREVSYATMLVMSLNAIVMLPTCNTSAISSRPEKQNST
ncbi:hypothetical protein HFD88_000418 [Aspergillus terreus]|nr:hypothetical protein HFD88_000418 [Aspergillus terreus]